MEVPKEVVEIAEEKAAEAVLGTSVLTVLGAAIPVVGIAALGAKLVSNWVVSEDDDGAEAAFKEWEKTQSLPVSGEEAHGFVNGYRWAKK
ncbi:hypothetical protein UFOVP139_35 [uncultured Caudovirales phage]|uniref:Uncharacterized protein n=1 Tax=uncultured Caudovirales phage TaxID=2100421 RepID=A0A6J5LH54_9CAUD|nr:hypothetical protein UFOVP139_35 [uncultured Caudovirales phage]